LRRQNYRFGRVQVLEGNVGYLQLNGFESALQAGNTAVAAMNFLGSTDALIIDLRDNGGGGPSVIQLIFSYLLAKPTQLSGIYIRESDTHIQLWTHAHVSGPRMLDIPVYVLVSDRTFSAAEAFAYDMKHLKRGTIIGETTRGGAHLVRDVDYPELYITVRVPFGRAISPVTDANWEGTGVKPDIAVPADEALAVAHAEAIRAVLKRETDGRWRQWLDSALLELNGQRD
jgi:C-terminal processing protease CtpA/Prc